MKRSQKVKLLPFSTLLKSREVEDPFNLWVHRPLAYAIVAMIYRTPITPNQITFISLFVGFAAGVFWFIGTSSLMIWGGILLWSSAILDGADGILARAKNMQSIFGRALDGSIDMVVAGVTVAAGVYHIWVEHHQLLHLVLAIIAICTALIQIYLYDFYRESFMYLTNPDWDGTPEQLQDVDARLEKIIKQGGSWINRAATHLYKGLVMGQNRSVALTNPKGLRQGLQFTVNEQTVDIARRYNKGPMKLWALISLAPHCYLMSICGIFNRLDLYLWIRVLLANAIFIWVLIWQRRASSRTMEELVKINAAPTTL